MFPLLLFLFIVVPIVELAVIIQVGGYIGVWQTIVLLVLDSVIGAVLVKREGLRAWNSFRRALAETRWPGDEVMQGGLILFGGALLLTPGFVTDLVGFLAVIPPTRAIASKILRSAMTPTPVREALRIRDAHGRRSRGGDGEDAGDGGRSRRDGRRGSGQDGVYDVEVVDVQRDRPRDERDESQPDAPRELGSERPDGPDGPDGPDASPGPGADDDRD